MLRRSMKALKKNNLVCYSNNEAVSESDVISFDFPDKQLFRVLLWQKKTQNKTGDKLHNKVMHNKPKAKVFCLNSLKMHRDISIRMKSIHNAQWQTFMNSCAGGESIILQLKKHKHNHYWIVRYLSFYLNSVTQSKISISMMSGKGAILASQ